MQKRRYHWNEIKIIKSVSKCNAVENKDEVGTKIPAETTNFDKQNYGENSEAEISNHNCLDGVALNSFVVFEADKMRIIVSFIPTKFNPQLQCTAICCL